MPIRTYTKPKKASVLHINVEENFRDATVTLPKRSGWALFLNGSYDNPHVHYEFITKQLAEGTHKFRLKTIDELGNISTEVDTAVNIADFRLPPRWKINFFSHTF